MENQGKIKVLIITEDGTELVNGEYKGVMFHGVTEKDNKGFLCELTIRKLSSMDVAMMIYDLIEDRDDVRKSYSEVVIDNALQSLNNRGQEVEECKL